ncbi:MAG: hypothetical protein K2W96_18890 [Gemmataceae bacterium]|nr:hypothetical protein [Gemmataceae bacterium]
MSEVRLLTCDPAHFHAALVQKEMAPGVSPLVHVYAPLGPDLLAHLARIAAFNSRPENPTGWEVEVHASPDFLQRMLDEKPGNVVVLSGRNRTKIDAILASLEAGLHVLADKPWVIASEDLWKLRTALDTAKARGLVALDIMTERHEIASRLQRELMRDPVVFGRLDAGTPERPGVYMESVHHLCKTVAGAPLRRPAWFFDVAQQGEGLSDVGTHLVDLVMWALFPEQTVSIDEIELLRARRVPTALSRADFEKATGEPDFPAYLRPNVHSSQLLYHANTTVLYRVRGVHAWLNVAWAFEAPAGQGDRHLARFAGTRSSVEVRQGEPEGFVPEVYVVPRGGADVGEVEAALAARLAALQPAYPEVGMERRGASFRLAIPRGLRTTHEAHFGEVMGRFLGYLGNPESLPAWEAANMLAKYHVTTHGVRLARAAG